MRDVVICEPLRTPVGRFGGALADVSAAELAATVIRALVERTGLRPDGVDDVVLGQCNPSGEAPAIGRVAALDAGLDIGTPGSQVDRRCGSGLYAICVAADQVRSGAADLVIAGGAESMSQVEFYAQGLRFGPKAEALTLHDRLARARQTAGGRLYPVPGGMIETAENLRREYAITRAEQDELAARSHERAVEAQASGVFAEEIVPVQVPGRRATVEVVDTDEHPRPGTTIESLGRLRPVRLSVDPDATVTAGNSSGQNDGAAACIVTTPERAAELGLRPLARLMTWALAGVAPERMGIAPVAATARVLQRTNLALSDIDLIELNEAFAAQVLAVGREWQLTDRDWGRVNVHGSGISLGHPVGATGARIAATMLRELQRRDGRYALETMCIGGGQGLAALFAAID